MSKKVRVAQWGGRQIIYLPLYLAEQLGLLAKCGIEVEVYPAGNDDEIFEEVASGRAAFGVGDPTFGAHAQRDPRGSKLVAGLIDKVCLFGITHHPEIRKLETPDDLVALRVGTFPRPSTAYAIVNYLKRRHERRLRSMEIVESPIGDQIGALAAGRVDIALELEPVVSLAIAQGLYAPLNLANFFPELLVTGITASAEILSNSPDVVQNVVSCVQKVLTLIRREPAAMADACRGMFPALPEEIIAQAFARLAALQCWPNQVTVSPLAWSNALLLRREMGEAISERQGSAFLDMRFAYQSLSTE